MRDEASDKIKANSLFVLYIHSVVCVDRVPGEVQRQL
jgi:hypothetical protein